MALIPPLKEARDEKGIALFIVITFVTILSILVTEFVYVAQVNQRMAYDGLDQLRAHYLAKSAFKLSLLRLKAYSQVKALVGGGDKKKDGGGGGGIPGVPKALIEKIWSFPFFYPFPTNIPGMTAGDKEAITKFQEGSGLEGKYSAVIESESSKYNLNTILAGFVPQDTPSPTPSGQPSPTPSVQPSPEPTMGPAERQESLKAFMNQIWLSKLEADEDFQQEYRDFRLDDLYDSIFAWADREYEPKTDQTRNTVKLKRAPFYSLQELHMVTGMEDKVFDVFAPSLTVNPTPGINVNTMNETTLKALTKNRMTKEEVEEFFKFRDSEEEDNLFKNEEDYFKYLQEKVAGFHGDPAEITRYKEQLKKENIRIVTDENVFKITVQATVNQSSRMIEAWVTLKSGSKSDSSTTTPGGGIPAAPITGSSNISGPGPGDAQNKPDSGLKITFMRIL